MHAGVPVRGRAAFWALLALVGATRLAVVLADHRSLIANDVYPDDAFYYLRIAANIVAGRGLTFDGLAPTNGFHPLYLLMVVPIMALSGGNLVLPIHLSGVLLTAWAIGTGVVLYALLQRVAGRRTALLGLLIWAICPFFILMGINGLETGVAVFFVLLVPLLYLSWFCGERPTDARRALAFGAVCGLAVLARIDLVLLLAAVAVDWLVRPARRRVDLTLGALAVAGAAAVWLPWGLVSHASTGHWLPLSGAASRTIALNFGWLNMDPIWSAVSAQNRLFDPAHAPLAYHADVATKLGLVFLLENPLLAPLRANVPARVWSDLDGFLPNLLFSRHPALATTLVLVAVIAIVWRRRSDRQSVSMERSSRPPRTLLAVYLAFIALGYTFYSPAHWYFNRYLVGPILLTTVYMLAEAARFFSVRERRAAGLIGALTIVACLLAQDRYFARLRSSDALVAGSLARHLDIATRLDPRARLGAFQAGIFGYFGGRDVVNLDGKVNQDAWAALRDKHLHDYIQAQGVRYVLDKDRRLLDTLCARHAPPGSFSYRAISVDGVELFEILDGH